jgi:hypothetical protein
MKFFILSLLIITTSTIGLAQEANPDKKIIITPKQQINKMYKGVLLVRLKTRKNSISALRRSGQNEKADKIQRKQDKFNANVISAFKTNFDFCPAYFFYSDFSQQVLDKEFDKIEFLDDSLQYDPNISLQSKTFLTAEFGIIEQDTAQYFDGYYYSPGEGRGQEKRTKYNGGPNMSFEALIIKSNKFTQLRRPFPYYVRTLNSLPIRRHPKHVVTKMNAQLHGFKQRINN